VGLIGLGVIGSGVARALIGKADVLAERVGCPLVLRRATDRDAGRQRSSGVPSDIFTTNADGLLRDPDIDIIIELIGGDTDALSYVKQAILSGKHVVTANKELIAKHGPELRTLAAQHEVGLRYEASVGGGIPIISPLSEDLIANKVLGIQAIINGTTNYIVTRMASEGADFADALQQAQRLGFAEANPANDIEGVDAAYKLAILASIAFDTDVHPDDIYHEGISRLAARDFRYARELGYAIRLLAIAKDENSSLQVRVHPALVPEDVLLAKVDGVFNAIEVEGDLAGEVVFYGRGAGAEPTSSAVIADVVRIAQAVRLGLPAVSRPRPSRTKSIAPMSEIVARCYIRLTIADMPGVLGQIAKILGDHGISIAAAIQKEAHETTQTAEIVIMTHPARESAVREAMRATEALPVVKEIGNLIRVVD
jgi:homoserine dehydrogenase